MLLLLPPAFAVEGMWLPEEVPGVAAQLTAAGLLLPPAQLADPKGDPLGAIVHVGEWCSGSFVGHDGLVLTNHHCTWDLLQYVSTPDHPRVDEGFAAASPGEELWGGPEAKLYVVEKDQDVTSAILGKLPSTLDDSARARAIDRARAEVVAKCEKAPDRKCLVTSEYGGRSYRLITQRVIRDVRLVYVPPMSVGEFGGDLDNFEWPRHDADFAVLRAYVAPNGSSAAFSPKNVPYHPPHALTLSPAGVSPGDFVAVAGFPGSTERYELAAQLRYRAEVDYPERLKGLQALETILTEEAERDAVAAGRLGAARAGLANSRKYYQGILDNVAASDVLRRKEAEEKELRDWIYSDATAVTRWGLPVRELDSVVDEFQQYARLDRLLLHDLHQSDLLGAATTIVHWAAQRSKKDLDRDDGYADRDREDVLAALDGLDGALWLPADRRVLGWIQDQARSLPADQQPAALLALSPDALYTSPRLTDAAYRRKLLDTPFATLAASDDPWIQLAVALERDVEVARERGRFRAGAEARLLPQWMDAVRAFRPGTTYPDANNTLRVTFGNVLGYAPRDGVTYLPQTTLAGFVAKAHSGRYLPAPPPAFVEAAANAASSPHVDPKLHDVPVNFLTDLDTTGGNSGSATLDAQGRLVGLIFDGNYESIAADWLFDPALTRSIHLDVRYLLWVLENDPNGKWVAEALTR